MQANPAPRSPGSRLIAPGCRIRPAGREGRIEVEATFPFGQWVPRQSAERALAGTPVLFEDRWYEVINLETNDAKPSWTYLLGPWPADESIRAPGELSAAAAQSARATFVSNRRREDLAWAVFLLLPIVGALPGRDQEQIESELGVRATHATFASALLGLALGVSGVLLMFTRSRGHDIGMLAQLFLLDTPFRFVWIWLVPESVVRLGATEPVGSLPMALPVAALGLVRRALWAPRPPAAPATGASKKAAKDQRDELRRFSIDDAAAPRLADGTPVALEITSQYDRDEWVVGTTGVAIEGLVYHLQERRRQANGPQQGLVFSFTVPEETAIFRRVVEWRPDQGQTLARAALHRERGLWVEPLAPLWGLLDSGLQGEIAQSYEYRQDRGTAMSLVATSAVGLVALLQVRLHFATHIGSYDDIVMAALGGWCLVETVLRTAKLRAGIHLPSAFAPLVAPLARLALR